MIVLEMRCMGTRRGSKRVVTIGSGLELHSNPVDWEEPVFATVGFGDITAKTQAARVLVTIQMMLDSL